MNESILGGEYFVIREPLRTRGQNAPKTTCAVLPRLQKFHLAEARDFRSRKQHEYVLTMRVGSTRPERRSSKPFRSANGISGLNLQENGDGASRPYLEQNLEQKSQLGDAARFIATNRTNITEFFFIFQMRFTRRKQSPYRLARLGNAPLCFFL